MSVISNAPTTPADTRTLRSDVIALRDQIGADPQAHTYGPDCLGCRVVAGLEDALLRDEDRHTPSGRGRA